MTDDTERQTDPATGAKAPELTTHLPKPPPQSVDHSLSAAIIQSRLLIEESHRILAESRKIVPPAD